VVDFQIEASVFAAITPFRLADGLRRLPAHWTAKLALVLALFGGFLVLGPIGLLAR
jgi:hypothetical protein